MHDEHSNNHRHVALRDEIVEDHGRHPLHAILVYINASRLCRIILLRNVYCDVTGRTREDLRSLEGKLDQFAFGDGGIHLRIRVRRIFVRGNGVGNCNDATKDGEETAHRSRTGTRKLVSLSSAETRPAKRGNQTGITARILEYNEFTHESNPACRSRYGSHLSDRL